MDAIAYKVEPGYTFPTEKLIVDAEEQRWRHACCEIPHGFYQDRIDPTILATHPIKVIGHALFTNYTDRGYVHTESRIKQHAPIPMGTKIIFNGQFTAVDDHKRGWMMHGTFTYHDPAGNLLLEVWPMALMADQTKMRPRPPAEASDPSSTVLLPPPMVDLEPGWELLYTRQMSPAKCLGYSGNTQNIIHTDPAHAQKFGYRMPIFAGNGMVQNLVQAMQKDSLQDSFDVHVRMLRPVHWDDGLAIIGHRNAAGNIDAVKALGPDGKVTNDLQVLA